jgi:hypothetical protein
MCSETSEKRAAGRNIPLPTLHKCALCITESVFSPAARPWPSGCAQTFHPRRWAKNVLD